MDGERNILVGERRQRCFGDDVLAVFQDLAGESPQENSRAFFWGSLSGKVMTTMTGVLWRNWLCAILSHAAWKQKSAVSRQLDRSLEEKEEKGHSEFQNHR